MANGLPFKVTDSREVSMLTPAGNMVTMTRVWLTTDRGATGTVDVAQSDWTTEKLAEILARKAESLDLAFALTGA